MGVDESDSARQIKRLKEALAKWNFRMKRSGDLEAFFDWCRQRAERSRQPVPEVDHCRLFRQSLFVPGGKLYLPDHVMAGIDTTLAEKPSQARRPSRMRPASGCAIAA